MLDKYYVLTIVTDFNFSLFSQTESDSKHNVDTTVDLTSRYHTYARKKFVYVRKTTSNALQWFGYIQFQNSLYNQFQYSRSQNKRRGILNFL